MSEERSFKGKIRREFAFVTGNFAIMLTSWFFMDFFNELPTTYYPLYIKALGGTASSIGLIQAAANLSQAFSQIPGGYLADKYGRKWLIFSMTAVAGFARVLYVFAPNWEWILLGSIITGFTMIYLPAMNALVADSVPSEKRGMAFSLINLIMSVSTTPSPLLAGFLYLRMGLIPSMRLSYGLVVIAFLGSALIRSRLTETLEDPKPVNFREIVSSYPQSLKESVTVWEKVPKTAFILFLVDVVMSFAIQMFMPIFVLYIIEDLLITEIQLSWIMASLFITMIIFAIPGGKLIDIIGKKKPIIFSYILWGIAIPLFVYGDFWRLILSMTMIGVLQVMMGSAANALTADLVPKEHRGKVNGSRGFWGMLTASIGAIMGGWIYDNVDHQLPFWLQYLFIIPIFFTVIFLVKEPDIK
ncbi:MFS transporter [Candidatus Bathyarchaeota archaeon]|nr:MFS transporter [Candidatus Bathyarchaeota archaeon]